MAKGRSLFLFLFPLGKWVWCFAHQECVQLHDGAPLVGGRDSGTDREIGERKSSLKKGRGPMEESKKGGGDD